MNTTRYALALALLLLPARAHAQEVLGFSFGGGLTFASGDVSETHTTGPNFGVRTVVPFSDRLAAQVAIGYQELRLRQDEALIERGYDPSTFRLGGGFLEGGNQRALAALVQAQLHLLPRSGRVSPYLLAGAGFTELRHSDVGIYFLGEWNDEPGKSEKTFAADAGAGVLFRFTPNVAVYGQGSYDLFFTDGGSTAMIPVHIGLLIELGSN